MTGHSMNGVGRVARGTAGKTAASARRTPWVGAVTLSLLAMLASGTAMASEIEPDPPSTAVRPIDPPPPQSVAPEQAPKAEAENAPAGPAAPAGTEAPGKVQAPTPEPEPVAEVPPPAQGEPAVAPAPAAAPPVAEAPAPAPVLTAAAVEHQALELLGATIPPGTVQRVSWYPPDSFGGLSEPTPVLVAHGSKPGPTLCLTAAIHGDELNGIEMVRRIIFDLDAGQLTGTVIGIPIVSLQGFRQGSRYLADRRDLNRYFPGDVRGSAAGRIAHSLFTGIIVNCDALIDLHTGSFHRTNLPQVRGDLSIEAVAHLTRGFGATSVLNSAGPVGSLRRAATDIGIPALTLEAGEPHRFQPEEVDHGVRALRSLLNHLEMVPRFRRWREPQPVYYESVWVRTNEGGILVSVVPLGAQVTKDQLLGTVTDPINNRRFEIRAPHKGRLIGMALNQSVIPGFAAYHLGIAREEAELAATPPGEDPGADDAPPEEASGPPGG